MDMLTQPAPIAFFVFNRPVHTRQTVAALQQNELALQSELFVFSDGPRNHDDETSIQEVRTYIKSITGFKKITLIEREHNLGLANSIISGVTDIINQHGRIIVLEDDLVTSRYFLRFLNDALDKYERTSQVMHITGYMYPVKNTDKLAPSFFYRQTHSWGWGTWKRAWDGFEPDAEKLWNSIKIQKLASDFDGTRPGYFTALLKYQIAGYVNSWMIRWYATVFLKKGLCLYPAQSLVSNIGNDGTGTHSGKNTAFDTSIADVRVQYFPEAVEESSEALKALSDFFRSFKMPLLKKTAWILKQKIKKFRKQIQL